MQRLLNKVCLVTGTASGIGKAIGELFHKEGGIVIFSDVNDSLGFSILTQFSERAEYIHLDVSNEENWVTVVDHIKEKYGKLDVLVNNAGITGLTETKGPHDPENLDLASWHKVHAIDSDGVALGCKYAIRLMKQNRWGSIVNICSRSALVGIPTMSAYAASKAAIRNHTKSVALYCAQKQYNIRCNAIHPAAILTAIWDPMFAKGAEKEHSIQEMAVQIPLGRMGIPLDVAYAALYLASDESAYVTGAELNVDGGIMAGSAAAPKKLAED